MSQKEGNKEHSHTLKFKAPLDTEIVNSSELDIDIHFTQII